VLYLERTPAPPLSQCIRTLWYARAPQAACRRERILPTGNIQLILNLARDFIVDCAAGGTCGRLPPALVVGARSVYEVVDTSDMADLAGLVFEPGGFVPFVSDAADLFSNRFVPLADVWGGAAAALRDRLLEFPTPAAKLCALEDFLAEKFMSRLSRNRMVDCALSQLNLSPAVSTVKELARSTGWSERRFSQVFREQVGFPPKVWCRIQRFQRAVRRLHAGVEVPWAELALDCGYYDQSHFANEFRAFSGIDATSYSARRSRWPSHVAAD
jgi:AraC-like DNA-binding protein